MTTLELEPVLQGLGLSPRAARAYHELIKRGPTRASQLAQSSGISRQTIYTALEELTRRGLASRLPIFPKRYLYQAAPPETVVDLARDRVTLLETHLPELRRQYVAANELPELSLYTGWPAIRSFVRTFAETVMRPQTSYASISAAEEWYRSDYVFMEKFWEPFKETHQITTRLLATRGWITDIQAQRPNYEVRLLPRQHPFHGDVTIYQDYVLFLGLAKRQLQLVVVKSNQIATTQRELFEIIWAEADAALRPDTMLPSRRQP